MSHRSRRSAQRTIAAMVASSTTAEVGLCGKLMIAKRGGRAAVSQAATYAASRSASASRRGAVGVAEPEVVDLLATGAQRGLALVDGAEHVGREVGEAGEQRVGHGVSSENAWRVPSATAKRGSAAAAALDGGGVAIAAGGAA